VRWRGEAGRLLRGADGTLVVAVGADGRLLRTVWSGLS